MARLPKQGELEWGDVLNDFLLVQHQSDGTHRLTKSDIGLSSVDNTPDATKPVSSAQQAAIGAALDEHDAADDPHHKAGYAIIKGGGRRIFVQATDPALVPSNNVNDGDLWIDTA